MPTFVKMISVILPFFNAAETLEQAIISVLEQTVAPLEILLINNNSTDKSLEIANFYVKANNQVFLYNEAEQGVVPAMNLGLKMAKGTWIARMDADDFWHKNKLEKQLQFAAENIDIQVIGSKVHFVAKSEKADGFAHYVEWSNNICSEIEINKAIFTESPLVNPSIIFRKSLIEKYGFYKNGDFPEDYEMFLRWHNAGVKMAKVPTPLMDWKDSEKRLTRTHEAYTEWAFNRVKCQYLALFLTKYSLNQKQIWIWGAGRKAKQKIKVLEENGVQIAGYIDLKSNNNLGKPCISFNDLVFDKSIFIISFVSNRGMGQKIKVFLLNLGFMEMEHFIIAS